ncbi:hypothetical protein ACIQLJ_16165 [Microbacterium sp. NPDC091313]
MSRITRRRRVDVVTITTSDGWALDGLLYPSGDVRDVVLLHLHGKGATMLDIHARWLPDALPAVAHFALNMRCHALAYNTDREDRPVAGGMYESLADGEADVRAAVEFLRAEGYRRIIVSGHSSGGYYAGVHTPPGDDIVGRILLSPLTDNKVALSWWFPQPGQLADALARARGLLEAGRPDELMPLPSWYWAISARSLLERSGTPGDEQWIARVNGSASPVLLGWGGTESRDELWRETARRLRVPVTTARLGDADHWYHGFERDMSDAVAGFVEEVAGVDARRGDQ